MSTKTISKATKGLGWAIATATITGSILLTIIAIKTQNTKKMSDDDFLKNLEIKGQNVSEIYASDAKITNVEYKKDSNYEINVSLEGSNVLKSTAYYKIEITNKNTKVKKSKIVPISGFKKFDEKSTILKEKELFEDKSKLKEYLDNMPKNDSENLKKYISKNKHFIYNEIPSSLKASFKGYSFIQSNGQDAVRVVFVLNGHITNDNLENNIVKKANKEYKNNEKTFEFYLSNLVKQGTSSSEIQARNNLRDLKEKYETLKKEAEVAKSKVTVAIVAEYENVLVSITKNINEIDKILNDATIKAADHVDTLKVNYEKDLLDKNTVDLKATINDAEVTRDNYKAKDETNYNNPIIEFNKAIDQAKIKLASTNIKEINDEISNLKTKKEEFINALKTILTDTQSDSKTKLLESSDYKYLIDDIKARKATFDATLNEDNILSEIENLEVLVQNTQTIDAITPKAIIEANNKLLASLLAYKTALEAKLHKIKQDVIDSTYDKDSLSQFIEYLIKKIKTTNESKALVNKQIDLFKAYLTTPGFVQKYNSLEKDFDKYEAIFNENINKANELIATLDAGLDQYSNSKDKYSEIKTKVDSLLAEQATRLSSIGTQIVNSALIDFDNYVQKQKALINTSRNNYKTIVTNVYNLFKDSEIYKQYIDDNKAKLTNSTIDVKTAFELLKTLYTKDNEMNQKVAAHSNLATNSYWNSLLDGDLKNNFTIPMQVNADYENYFKLDDHYKMALDIIMDNLISQIRSEHIKGIEAKQEEIYRIFYEKMRAIYNAQLTNGVKFVNDNILDAKNRRIQALKEYEKALKEAENLIKHYTDEHYNNTDDFFKTLEEGIKAVKTLNKDRAMLSLVKNTTIELKEVIKNSQDQYRTFLLSKLDEARKNWQIYSNSINGPEHQDVFPKTIKLINESLEKIKNAIDNSTTITIKELEDLVKENNDVYGKYTSTKIPEWNAFIKKFDSAFEELEAIKKDYKKETIVKLGKDKYQDNDLVLNPAFEANSVYQKAKEYKESGKLSVEKNLKTSKEHITKIKAKIEEIKQLVNYYETKWNQAKTNLDNTIKTVEEYITNNPSATNIDQLQALLNSTKEAIETSKLEEVNLTKLQQLDKDLEAKYQEVLNKNNSLAAAKNKLQSSIEKVENHLNSRNSLDNLDNSYYSNLMQNEKIDYNENSSTAASKKDLKSILDSMKNIVKGDDENAINHNVQFGQKLIDAIEEKRTEDIVAKQNTLKDKLNEYNDLKDSLKSLSSKDYYGAQITNLEANSTADEDADRITKLARANLIKESQKSIVNTKVELEKLIGNLTKIKTDREALIRQANDQYNTNKDKFAELQKQLNDLNITPATIADYNTKVKPKLEAANNKNELLKEVSKDQNNSNITAKINDSKVAIQDLENVVNNYKTALNNKIKENISAIKELVQYIRNNPNNLTLPANFVTNLKAVEDNQDSTDIAILNQTKTQSEALIKELTDLINTAVATVNNKAQDTNQKVEEEKAKNETWMTAAQVREIQQLFDNSQALFNEVKNAANNKD
ncbi:coiled-coil domain-containing protein [Mycoplasmopsis fermentans]|uniref:Uncharacterized protein n=1 Tax=Mycoplasmopsis fermentans (strain M64) TaxID=943945 RepID=A0AB32XBM7_MYCFM|nr:hypothetical protein [Mycoplasmopsis fermentans]ADV34367.1 Hypothetical Protein MfeM64YM_0364 [Mycoplasmopsis fermentans M64]